MSGRVMTKLFIAGILLTCLAGFGQAPGYMGKRFLAGYGIALSPAITGSDHNGNSIFSRNGSNATKHRAAFNFHQEGFAEYVLSNRLSLGLSARFCKTTYDNMRETYALVPITYHAGYNSVQRVDRDLQGLYSIKALSLTLYGKLYFRRALAPWGGYIMFGPTLKRYTCSYNPDDMYMEYEADNDRYKTKRYSDFGPQNQSYNRFDISFGFGKSRIFYNRIVLDYGFNVQLFSFMLILFDQIDEGLQDNATEASLYMKKTGTWRTRGINRANGFLRIGILLF
jgi:hypothetical protein